ncbi:MAG TPA: hypothetical protein VKB69_09945 [Micromonosporaceae bacterium]|nr:hypothetical protein [Micromonosporaceae bacterium]
MGSDIAEQLLLGVGSSVITGTALWSGQRARATLRARSRRRFLGLVGPWRHRCLLVVGRNPRQPNSINAHDVAAMLEIAALVRPTGAEPLPIAPQEVLAVEGDTVEFCLTGRDANPRTQAHVERWLPGLMIRAFPEGDVWTVGDRQFTRDRGKLEYVVLARICRPDHPHLFLIAGQSGVTNRAAARFLVERLTQLRRRYSDDRSFCLLLRVIAPATYGYREIEEVADITELAKAPVTSAEQPAR